MNLRRISPYRVHAVCGINKKWEMQVRSGLFASLIKTLSIFLLLITPTFSVPTDPIDILALKDLYDSLNGTAWKWNTTSIYPIWNFTTPLNLTNPCDPIHWQRVMCVQNAGINRINTIMLHSFGLAGYLPTSIGNLIELSILDLNTNHIIGPVPHEIGNLTKLRILSISINLFSGEIPSSIGNLVNLDDFDLDNNRLTKNIPSSFGILTALRYLDMDNNYLTGTIPNEMQTMSSLVDLDLDKNKLTGTIPSSLSKLHHLMYLSLDTNRLVGTIPSEIGLMTQLNVLLLQNNRLTGSLGTFLWQATNLSLVSLDVSGNTLSGTIPDSIFTIPHLNILSLSVNCFEGPLPDTVCRATSASILAMDSLSSASSCKHSWSVLFTNRMFWRYYGGSYPQCITALPNLIVLHLSGNGMSGQLGVIPPYSKLRNITLTHNRLTGTIPESFQVWPFLNLDLSVNRLTGEFFNNVSDSYTKPSCFGDITPNCSLRVGKISLAINRLSGKIPSKIYRAKRVDILADNTFSCGHLPSHDPVVNYYTCGSTLLDISMGVFGFVLICLLTLVILIFLSFKFLSKEDLPHQQVTPPKTTTISSVVASSSDSARPTSQQTTSMKSFWYFIRRIFLETRQYLRWNQYLMSYCLPNLQGFNDLMDQFLKGIIILSAVGIILNMPTYGLKFEENGVADGNITTHMWMYRWVFSLVFVSGRFPAIMLIIAWMISVLVIDWILRTQIVKEDETSKRDSISSRRSESNRLSVAREEKDHDSERATVGNIERPSMMGSYAFRVGSFLIRSIINSGVVMTVHVVFVYFSATAGFTPGVNLLAQFSLGLFMLGWNNVVLPELILKSDPTMFVWDKLFIRVLMLLFNMIVVPCIATAFTRPSCFQHVLSRPDEISASYSYTECGFSYHNDTTGEDECLVPDDITIQLKPATPPMIYNFQCGSELLTDYIPVYIYTYSFLILLPFARYIWLWNVPIDSFPGDSSYTLFVPSGIMYPDYWNALPSYLSSVDIENDEEGDADTHSTNPSPLHITSSYPRTLSGDDPTLNSPSSSSSSSSWRDKRKKNPTKNRLWKPDSILSRLITHSAILLTFGVCSPVLSLAIVLAVIISILEWKYVLGRFFFRRFTTILHYNPVEYYHQHQHQREEGDHHGDLNDERKEEGVEDGKASSLLMVAIDSVSGYCDVNGEEKKSGVDYTFVCLEESLTGILLSTGRCLIMVVTTSALFMAGFAWDMVADREGWQSAIWAPILVCVVPIALIVYSITTQARVILRPRSKSTLSTNNILLLRTNTLSSVPLHHSASSPSAIPHRQPSLKK